jgi:hypothetical protein
MVSLPPTSAATPLTLFSQTIQVIPASLAIRDCHSYDKSLQVNAPVGTEGFVAYQDLVIEKCTSHQESKQFNYPQAPETIRAVAGPDAQIKDSIEPPKVEEKNEQDRMYRGF